MATKSPAASIRIDRFSRLKALQRPTPAESVRYEYEEDIVPVTSAYGSTDGARDIECLNTLLGATVKNNQHGEHLSIQCWNADYASHVPALSALRLFAPDAGEEALNPDNWLFLDTETTGLAGGTGTYPFLVGIAWWEGGGLQIEQLFMREYSEERSLLAALSERLAERPVLVTFNGKSFDWPLLETRYRMTRKITVPSPSAHLDFLHPARNIWRMRLGSVKLSQLERHVLGWDRGPDMPSEQIPKLYSDFVREGRAEPLVPVFLHNQLDLRGLAGLSSRILSVLGDDEAPLQEGLDLLGLSRICDRRGESKRARALYERTIQAELPSESDRAARVALARIAKGEGDMERALQLWEGMLGNSREGYEAYEQLAIYYEHHAHMPQRAAEITRAALLQLRRANQVRMIATSTYRITKQQFEHRLCRLERKLKRKLADLFE